MNPLEAFPGGADEAREFIHYMRDDEPKLSVRSQAVCDLALLGLDSLAAADPEREGDDVLSRWLALDKSLTQLEWLAAMSVVVDELCRRALRGGR